MWNIGARFCKLHAPICPKGFLLDLNQEIELANPITEYFYPQNMPRSALTYGYQHYLAENAIILIRFGVQKWY
jgi:hypothetical protein